MGSKLGPEVLSRGESNGERSAAAELRAPKSVSARGRFRRSETEKQGAQANPSTYRPSLPGLSNGSRTQFVPAAATLFMQTEFLLRLQLLTTGPRRVGTVRYYANLTRTKLSLRLQLLTTGPRRVGTVCEWPTTVFRSAE